MKASPLQSKIQKLRQVLRAAAPRKGGASLGTCPCPPVRAAVGTWPAGEGDSYLRIRLQGHPGCAWAQTRCWEPKAEVLCWGPHIIRVGAAGPHELAACGQRDQGPA